MRCSLLIPVFLTALHCLWAGGVDFKLGGESFPANVEIRAVGLVSPVPDFPHDYNFETRFGEHFKFVWPLILPCSEGNTAQPESPVYVPSLKPTRLVRMDGDRWKQKMRLSKMRFPLGGLKLRPWFEAVLAASVKIRMSERYDMRSNNCASSILTLLYDNLGFIDLDEEIMVDFGNCGIGMNALLKR